MKLDTLTLIFALSLILSTQVVALFLQYRVNRTYKGTGYWLIGSSLMALGFILMPTLAMESTKHFAIIANPLVIGGHIFLYMGIKRFFGRKFNKQLLSLGFLVFNLIYYYYMYIQNSISARTVVISLTTAIIGFMIAYQLYVKKDETLSHTGHFMVGVFLVYGCFYGARALLTLLLQPVHTYKEQGYTTLVVIIVCIISSNLWTLGLILMINQRLNAANKLEREKLRIIFNTGVDAQLITRLEDGFIIDVNDEFFMLTGYTKEEVVGSNTKGRILWLTTEDRKVFTRELNAKGVCRNMEFVFRRKDGSQFNGAISARIINIHSVTHIISMVRDITQMKELVEQLEIEKNTAQLNAITDSLTGLFNRGYFDNTLRTEISRLARSNTALSLIMVDIDFFKNYNDTYGHLAGDKCIQMIATTLKASVERASDVVARYGGEEFILILPETDEAGAQMLGELIRRGIQDLAIPHQSSKAVNHVTVSVGITTTYPTQTTTPEHIIKYVDQALYQAKETGRNRCIYLPTP